MNINKSPAFLYGESLFTTTRVKKGEMLFESEHLERLWSGIENYFLNRALESEEKESMKKGVEDFLQKLPLDELRLRLTVYAPEREGLSKASFSFEELKLDFKLSDLKKSFDEELSLKSFPSPFSSDYPNMKMGSYMPLLYLQMRARREGSDDALLLDREGNVVEASTSNIFFYKGEKLFTPIGRVLEGVIKRKIESVYDVERMNIHIDSLSQFDGAFLTNSSWILRPVQSIDQIKFKSLNQQFVRDMLKDILKRGYK